MPRKIQKAAAVSRPTIKGLLAHNQFNGVDELSTDGQTFFEFLVLIVDIKYRNKYGKEFADQYGRGYSQHMSKNAVAGQVSPVDDGLLRH